MLADPGVSKRTWLLAGSAAAFLLVASAICFGFGQMEGPILKAFIPIVATLWFAGDLLTAFLLYSHYRVTGTVGFLVTAYAYAVTGLLTVPYLAAFPNVFVFDAAFGQISVWIWASWHVLFALVIGTYFVADPSLRVAVLEDADRLRLASRVLFVAVIIVAAIAAGSWYFHDSLPVLVQDGRFTDAYRLGVAPGVAFLCVICCAAVFARNRNPSRLHVWIGIALMTAALDAALNGASTMRYGLSWYAGKLETLVTAMLLLVILLREIELVYGQMAAFARYDTLTGLRNRHSFDETARWMFNLCQRRRWPVAVYMIDIDHFKRLNDRFGHPTGDECLKRVAASLKGALKRKSDLLARYGGEEFVAMVADIDAASAQIIGNRLLRSVGESNCAPTQEEHLTISVGMAWTPGADVLADHLELLDQADQALYEAKARGRNRCVASVVEHALEVPDSSAS